MQMKYLFLLCLLVGCNQNQRDIDRINREIYTKQKMERIVKVKYEGHRYLMLPSDRGMGLCHDENCECRQKDVDMGQTDDKMGVYQPINKHDGVGMTWAQNFIKRIKDLQFLIEVTEIIVTDIEFDNIYYELFVKPNKMSVINEKEYTTFDKYPMNIVGVKILTNKMKQDEVKYELNLVEKTYE